MLNVSPQETIRYRPEDWYWIRESGLVFSSRRIQHVEKSDQEFADWLEAGNPPSAYPRDEDGVESVVELQKVLEPYSLHATLQSYAGALRYQLEIAGVDVQVGGETVRVSTARDNRDGMRDTMLRIIAGLRQDGDVLKIFSDNVPRKATNAEAQAAIAAASSFVQDAFNREEIVVTDIASGKIQTKEEVEEAFGILSKATDESSAEDLQSDSVKPTTSTISS